LTPHHQLQFKPKKTISSPLFPEKSKSLSMNANAPLSPLRLPGQKTGFDIGAEVIRRSGVDFNTCLHCRGCASDCPFVDAMEYHPHGFIRLLQFKQTEQALSCACFRNS